MVIELNKLSKYYDVRKRAIRTKYWLERKTLTREGERVNIFAGHLKDTIKHPTSGLLSYNNTINEGYKNEELYNKNIKFMLKDKRIQNLLYKLITLVNNWYPLTKSTRNFIIKTGRISFDEVRPVKHDLQWLKFKMLKTFGIV